MQIVIAKNDPGDLASRVASGEEELLSAGTVAKLLAVDPKTVTRWAKDGKLISIRTPGNHRRFLKSEITAYLRGEVILPRVITD